VAGEENKGLSKFRVSFCDTPEKQINLGIASKSGNSLHGGGVVVTVAVLSRDATRHAVYTGGTVRACRIQKKSILQLTPRPHPTIHHAVLPCYTPKRYILGCRSEGIDGKIGLCSDSTQPASLQRRIGNLRTDVHHALAESVNSDSSTFSRPRSPAFRVGTSHPFVIMIILANFKGT